MLRVDLQLHSRFSDRPSEWILRRLGMPQSYSEPEALYRKLAAAGMTLEQIVESIAPFVWAPLDAARDGRAFESFWAPKGPWSSSVKAER